MNVHQHPHSHPHQHPQYDVVVDRRALLRSGAFGLGAALLAACASSGSTSTDDTTPEPVDDLDGTVTTDETASTTSSEADGAVVTGPIDVPAGFDAFADSVNAFADGDVWLVESNGIPAHPMMVGITNWQQQVPVPQPYTAGNAWQFPRSPVVAAEPVSARTGLFRGAIALAVNGIPIFNALNNRGDDAFLVGELDEFGGHCGRADDYHYHVAPLHLEDVVGPGVPIAYALDGFAIYGAVEPDGSAVSELDEYNGHIGADGVYHYHGTTSYPYINGGLVGEIEISDQVEPQPTTPAFRPAGEPLAGAVITAFEELGEGSYRLEYDVDGAVGSIDYTVDGSSLSFEFTSPTGEVTTETYSR